MPLKDIIKIKNKLIGQKCSVFIIAEAGVNHNGSLDLAKKMVDLAKISGVDAIKFQTFKGEDVVTRDASMVEYQKKNTGKKQTQLEMLKKIELSYLDFNKIKIYCDKKKIIFLSTPHSEDAVDFLEPLVPAYKIGSGDLTNLPLLEKIARKNKPIILSTGMSDLYEVMEAVKLIKKNGNKKLILLHCTTNYPCRLGEVNLRAMLTLKNKFKLPIGYSDHTEGILAPIAAVSMGARVLEKHFTLDKNLPGPDHRASLDPKELREMVDNIREIEKILGSKTKKSTQDEEKIKKLVRKSIVAKKYIMKGEKITADLISIKRPGFGIQPVYLDRIIGRIAKEDIRDDQLIKWKMLS